MLDNNVTHLWTQQAAKMIDLSNKGWSYNSPPSEPQIRRLKELIPDFPEAVLAFLNKHNGAYGDMQPDIKPPCAKIYDVDTIIEIFEEHRPELRHYLVFGTDLFDEYLAVRLQPEDSPVYSVLILNIYELEPTEEEVIFDSFCSFMNSRLL